MATKAQHFKADEIQSRRERAGARSQQRAKKPEKRHNLGERAGRKASVRYEESATTPSRKSTRRSKHHLRAASPIERTAQLRASKPQARAATANAKRAAVRGKRGSF